MDCLKTETGKQQADFLTKTLGRQLFEKYRKLVMGWFYRTHGPRNRR